MQYAGIVCAMNLIMTSLPALERNLLFQELTRFHISPSKSKKSAFYSSNKRGKSQIGPVAQRRMNVKNITNCRFHIRSYIRAIKNIRFIEVNHLPKGNCIISQNRLNSVCLLQSSIKKQ